MPANRMASSVAASGRPGNVRNCDACRRKKTKCDRLPSCSNCKSFLRPDMVMRTVLTLADLAGAMRGIACTYDDAGETTVGTLMENHVLILRLRQNIFALAQHLRLSPRQLQQLAEKADNAMQETSSLDGVGLAKRKRRSLHEILLGVMQDQEAARAHPRMAEPPAPYAPLKKRLAGATTSGPKQTHTHGEHAHLKNHHQPLHSPQRKEGNPVVHVPARRFSDPPPGQPVFLPSFQRIVPQTQEPARAAYVVLPPIQIREQDISTEIGSSPLSSRTPASLPSSLHSALSTSPESCATPLALKSVGGLQMPVVQSTGLPSRFNDYRLPPPRPSQPLYQGVGPSLAAFVTSPSIGHSE